ncbi:DNA-binding transcriptional regulator, LysR family [Klebsiella quasipneumoniae]|uniref:LysR family transcriptional regulator n=1 Tax=Klebsiella quasipneumoniae TaxID=1463165 RepID=UPI0008712DCF|nr:LysR family transcriptional regulator [Klebsiella quasipneumoniae]SCW43601.1 DNA-binding transcriptional regulator, LysR family [Klebsiella quasipneumoniae]SCX48932.1 DNA-binding transcriptional regulator, LysR family [Klebsiella quasipneumoniae]SCX51854.1 DNA-binding transcriptional regulator, LysR family [Klebsiella quasipneumoniae]SCY13781.1 DNA-binding transcriptional regulator, LysR family [Klebsiella quasipneumoniae]SCY23333.1 DNA-binding transcriptional regulator, LysR family [Klebsi
MRIDDIDALLATVQFSSLNQAADYLGITQSAITRRLQRLEQELNVTLLARQTRPLTLTAAGQRVYEQCLSIKRETKKLYSLLDPEGEPRGALRLGVPQSISEIALPAALAALSQQFPALSPQVACGWSGELQRRLENGELDGRLAMGPAQQTFAEGYSGRLLCPLEVVPIAARRLNLRASSLRECVEQGWILNPDGCGLRAGLIRELQSQGLRLKLNVESAGAQLQMALVAQGLGLGLVPRAALAASPWRDELEVVNLSDFQPAVSLWLIHARYLANLQSPLTFFASKVVQQLTVSD